MGALKRMFRSMGEEVVGGCRRLHNEELHNQCTSPDIIRVIIKENEMSGACTMHAWEMRKAYKVLVGKLKGRDH